MPGIDPDMNMPGDPGPSTLITAFAALDASIQSQTVPHGTPKEQLTLPKRLKVIFERSSPNASVYGTNWTCAEYDGNKPGTYVFTPSWAEGSFTFVEGITYPQITVTVEAPVQSTVTDANISSWDELTDAVNKLKENEILNATITENLDATSALEINGKEVRINASKPGLIINRILASGANTTNPIFKIQNDGVLTVGENGNQIIYHDDTLREKSHGLFYVYKGTLNLSHALFENFNFGQSSSSGAGYGAIYTRNSNVSLDTIEMKECVGVDGTFIYIENSSVSMNHCHLHENKIWGNSGSAGGVIKAKGNTTVLEITNSKISGNTTAENGGAFANSVGALHFYNAGQVVISDSTISDNKFQYGAGIAAVGTSLILNEVNVINNTAIGDSQRLTDWQGAGIYFERCSVDIKNTTISGNTGSFIGGGVYANETNLTLDETVTIQNNTAACGGGIYVDSGTLTLAGAKIQNNTAVASDLFAKNVDRNGSGGGIAIHASAVVNLQSGDITGNTATRGNAIWQNNMLNISGTPNVTGDIYLTTGHVVNVVAEYQGSNLLIDMDKNVLDAENIDSTYQEGRNVIVYHDELAVPTYQQASQYVLHDSIQTDGYFLNYESKTNEGVVPNPHILELSKTEMEKPIDPNPDPDPDPDPNPGQPENHRPVIHATDKTINVGDPFNPLADVTATDVEDGLITHLLAIYSNTVDTSKAGKYTVTYMVTDNDGNTTTKTITVTVVNPNVQPPTDPNKPSNPSKPEKPDDSKRPPTSNFTHLGLYASMLAGSSGTLAVLANRKHHRKMKKKKQKRNKR